MNTNSTTTKQFGPKSACKTKLDVLIAHLRRPGGATITELAKATGWQDHSVRGAIAGTLRKKGHDVVSEKLDGVRRYRLGKADA